MNGRSRSYLIEHANRQAFKRRNPVVQRLCKIDLPAHRASGHLRDFAFFAGMRCQQLNDFLMNEGRIDRSEERRVGKERKSRLIENHSTDTTDINSIQLHHRKTETIYRTY